MRNPIYEQAITKEGCGFEYAAKVSYDDIDDNAGLKNQARLISPLDDALVDQYASAKEDGAEFPPLVLWRPGKGRWIPVDGNHNIASDKKLKRKFHDAYLLDIKDKQVADRITWTFNNKVNGRRLSPEECLEHAVSFVSQYQTMTMEQAAKEWGVPIWKVKQRSHAQEVRKILQKNNVKSTLDDDKLQRLQPLVKLGEDVLTDAAKVIINNGLGQQEIIEINQRVNRAGTSEEKKDAINTYAESEAVKRKRAETKGGTILPPRPLPWQRLVRLLTEANRLFEDYPKNALKPLSDYKAARELAADLDDHLTVLFGLGARKEKTA